MAKLNIYNFITLDGYYKGVNNDLSWHQHGAEEGEFAAKNAQSDSTLVFGRKTYEMMAGFWPTQQAKDSMPGVAKGMNESDKIVFSTTLRHADWNNTSIIRGDLVQEISRLKESSEKPMTVLGSGTIVTQLANAGLIDSYQIMLDPVAIGEGTSIFKGLDHKLALKLTSTHTFRSGVILLNYEPV